MSQFQPKIKPFKLGNKYRIGVSSSPKEPDHLRLNLTLFRAEYSLHVDEKSLGDLIRLCQETKEALKEKKMLNLLSEN